MASSQNWVYKQAFGTIPDNSIKLIHAKYEFGTDFTVIFLNFEITDANYIEFLDDNFFKVSKSDFKNEILFIDHPDWFKPLEDSQTIFFNSSTFAEPRVFLSFGEKNNMIYYYSMTAY